VPSYKPQPLLRACIETWPSTGSQSEANDTHQPFDPVQISHIVSFLFTTVVHTLFSLSLARVRKKIFEVGTRYVHGEPTLEQTIARFNLIQIIPTIVLSCSQTVYVYSRQVFVQAARGRYGEHILHTRRMADRTIPEVHVFQSDLPS
jgi:hypothetical protein